MSPESNYSQKISPFTSFSAKTIKALFFAFLSLFFLIGGAFNTVVMLAFITSEDQNRDWGYLLAFALTYLILSGLSIYKTIKTIKQLKKIATEPAPQITPRQGILKIVCSWPMIILTSGITLLLSYIGISILFVIAFKGSEFLNRGIQGYLEYFILVQIVSGVILGLAFINFTIILQRLRFSKK
jgi:uncharacterized membrane protein (UPF0136 family)